MNGPPQILHHNSGHAFHTPIIPMQIYGVGPYVMPGVEDVPANHIFLTTLKMANLRGEQGLAVSGYMRAITFMNFVIRFEGMENLRATRLLTSLLEMGGAFVLHLATAIGCSGL